ncbi:hypothetical protein B0A50_05548 [Salinomyces thailandicus]|uniref:G protein-coupled receptor GPR1/2/3 C-terminal domain-containing protein n=1 Tax=Salinomyces thailandicus TaxID=706561 RepID=A0A4U0TVK4_9PEZI|nr:hypothetical protein B0A50_05548 [Salinomyces thailandica]
MVAPYSPLIQVDGGEYFPPPYSVRTLSSTVRHGLIPVGILATASVISTIGLIGFISWRILNWRMHYKTFVGYNQYVVLVLNLLLADLQQAAAFLISFHWVNENYILAPHPACFAQGWLLHSGDVASAFFVLAIALHTFFTAVYGKRIGTKTFYGGVSGAWIFSYFLTGLGVGMHGSKYFVRAGAWCWVSSEYERDRLALHYIWLFIVEFGTILIYCLTFWQLRAKTSQLFAGQQVGHNLPNQATVEAVNRITKLMTLYPCVYVVLTLPLAAGRMWSMAHHGAQYSDTFSCVAAALLTSCGWVDAALYTLTRKALLRDTMPGHGGSSGRGRRGQGSSWEATELGQKGITHTRTVTVEDGMLRDTWDDPEGSDAERGRSLKETPTFMRDPSPSGSIDPILSGRKAGQKVKTEVSVGFAEMPTSESSEASERSRTSSSHHRRH